MNLGKMMSKNMVDLQLNASNKRDAIIQMSNMLFEEGRISSRAMFIEDVYKREELETTNMDMGVAIPHSKSSAIKKTTVALARLSKEISWEDFGEPVKIIFMLAVSPNDKGTEHLEIISKIAELLIDEKFLRMLNRTRNVNKLLRRINKLVGK
ncbi:MAG: fructose PTS transporter subunit IIA [Eubacteriales bacterium]